MSTIEEFIEARLAADEAAAKAAQHGGSGNWVASGAEVYAVGVELSSAHRCDQHDPGVPNECDDTLIADVDDDHLKVAEHIARRDPTQTLREVAAHRDLLEFYAEVRRIWHLDYLKADFVLGKLATIWSDHPDFQQEWVKAAEVKRSVVRNRPQGRVRGPKDTPTS